jgi:pyridoxine 5-phosphate synthase
MRKKLGVNIDHVSTLRQARMADYPDPVYAASIVELAGADGITVHLREDRRHMQDRDIYLLRNVVKTGLNLEMALNPEIIDIALRVIPDDVCIVPERREEVTTEGGLDVIGNRRTLEETVPRLRERKIQVSIFIDPEERQILAAKETGADYIEIHTGAYANAKTDEARGTELERVRRGTEYALSLGLRVNAGHGLNYRNVMDIAKIDGIEVLNIGHSIISQAIFVGLDRAVRDMIALLDRAFLEGLSAKG